MLFHRQEDHLIHFQRVSLMIFICGLLKVNLIDVDSTKQYDEDMKVLGSIEKSLVRRLRKDLNNGYIVTNSVPRDNTHYLKDHSKPSKFLRFTKDLTSTMDRFDYNIYKPTLDAASRTVTIRIVIQSLLDHNIPGQGTYSDTEE